MNRILKATSLFAFLTLLVFVSSHFRGKPNRFFASQKSFENSFSGQKQVSNRPARIFQARAPQSTKPNTLNRASEPEKISEKELKELNADEQDFKVFLAYLKQGPMWVKKNDYELARRRISSNPLPAVKLLQNLITNSQLHEVELRQGLFAAWAQIVDDVKTFNPSFISEILPLQIETVRSEVSKLELYENHTFDGLSEAQKKELTHFRPFVLKDNKLYSVSLPAQLSALFLLGISQSEVTNSELRRIASSPDYAIPIRKSAANMLNSSLFK